MPLRRRMSDLGVKEPIIDRLVNEAVSDPGWRPVAALDAATRMMASIVRAGGLTAGDEISGVLERFYQINIEGDVIHVGEAGRLEGASAQSPLSFKNSGLLLVGHSHTSRRSGRSWRG